ncbi:MAG: hypothetical protein B0W54_18260 [Cellvibrio sp. 79]|nr:MAG: hypothetical protein B0W54_18260 [Cellvibrio sp. 79]
MNDYLHHVSGFFAHDDQAREVNQQLLAAAIPLERIHLLNKTTSEPFHPAKEDSNGVLKEIVVDSGIGAVVGTGVGALAQLAFVASNVTLFVASPLIAPLVMLGWGAGLGGFLGAAVGAAKKEKPFEDLVRDAIEHDQYVVIVETVTKEETETAKKIIKDAVGDYEDVKRI